MPPLNELGTGFNFMTASAHQHAPIGDYSVSIADARRDDMPLVFVSEGFERLTGFPRAEIIGRNCRFLQGEETDQPGLATVRAALEEGSACSAVLRNFRRDGAAFWNQFNMAPLRNPSGLLTHFVGVQNRVLENEARHIFTEASDAGSSWESFAKHFRSHSIALEAPLKELTRFRQRLGEAPSQAQSQFTLETLEGATGAEEVVHDLVTLAWLHQSKPVRAPVDFHAVVSLELQRLAPLIDRRNIAVDMKIDEPVHGDRTRIAHWLRVILRNAIRAGVATGNLAIGVGASADQDKNRIWLEDNAGSMDQDTLDRLATFLSAPFKPNMRFHAGTEFCVCNKVARDHRGRFYVEPLDAARTRFVMEWPGAQ